MPVLGLGNRTEAVVAALRLLRRHAFEAAVLAAVDAEYGPDGIMPAGTVTAGIASLVAAEEPAEVAAGGAPTAAPETRVPVAPTASAPVP